ncbi:MAG: thioesterase family protein [Myxococcota bacterium]|nr:thioesterase family protein [Myxococcota bacterium]
MNKSFRKTYPVRFGEIDHAGVMYYPAIFDRIHRAFEDFWAEALGRGYAEVLERDGVGFPLVDLQASFRKPFRFGDSVEITLTVVEIGTRSVSFDVLLSGSGDDGTRAQARLVTAVIDMDTFRPTALPEALAEALQPFQSAPDHET